MTRINTIAPSDLANEWLLSEWRELPRIVNELEKHPRRYKAKDTPASYTLNAGHVKFFRDKLLYLAKRHRELKRELRKRNINHDKRIKVELHYLPDHLKMFCCNDWTPTQQDHGVLIERLQERFDLRKKPYSITDGANKTVIDCEHSFNEYCNKHLGKYL